LSAQSFTASYPYVLQHFCKWEETHKSGMMHQSNTPIMFQNNRFYMHLSIILLITCGIIFLSAQSFTASYLYILQYFCKWGEIRQSGMMHT
jgi:hypothetical protein